MARLLAALLLVALLAPALPAGSAADAPVRIAVLDTGIAAGHSQFAPGQVVAWRDFVNGRASPYDDQGHGTAVASRVAGATLGAYPGAQLLVGKVLREDNSLGAWGLVAEGIRWATDEGADVISISIWGDAPQPQSHVTVARAIEYASSHDVLVVWIAGNAGLQQRPSTLLVGSGSPKVLVVGASDDSGARAPFSQVEPELLAPGWNVPIASHHGGITFGSGTSFAAPWVAGVAGRMLAEGAPRDPDWLEWVILHSARDTSLTYAHEGYGVLLGPEAAHARAVARGEAPVPALDERDAFHVATTAPRVALSAQAPQGALPP